VTYSQDWYIQNRDSYLKKKRDYYHQKKREIARLKMKEPVYEMTPERFGSFERVLNEINNESVKKRIRKQLGK
jgi:hypothetical protein